MTTEALRGLIDRYWALAYAEGKEGRDHDTESGDAQRVSCEIDALLAHLDAVPTQVAAMKYDDVLVPFMSLMRKELHTNCGKGDRPGWLGMDANTALLEVYYHLAKLQKAVRNNDGPAIQEYSADVANMSMMVLDICGGLSILHLDAAPSLSDEQIIEIRRNLPLRVGTRYEDQIAFARALLAAPQVHQGYLDKTAKERFAECGGAEEASPLERLRFFCSLSMKIQDWMDVEPFFDDLAACIQAAEAQKPNGPSPDCTVTPPEPDGVAPTQGGEHG